MKRMIVLAALGVVSAVWAGPVAACTGDCNTDGTVTVDEVVQGVNIALGMAIVGRCVAFDVDASTTVTVDEVVLAVNSALNGCPTFSPGEYTARIELDDQVADITFTADADGSIAGDLLLSPLTTGRAAGQAAGGVSVNGSVNYSTGQFSISGNVNGLAFSVSGSLPSSQGGGSISITIGGQTYTGGFGSPTPTPTPTSPSSTHVVNVGQANSPFDPEVIEINPGETVTWTWVAGTHSVRSGIAATCSPDSQFDSGTKSSGTFSHTFTTPGTYEYFCGVSNHCQNFETGIVIVRGAPTATPTRTATRTATPPATPTATATADIVDGVSRQLLGFFSGQFMNQFGGSFEVRFQIEQVTPGSRVLVTDLTGWVLGQFGQLTLNAETPTKVSFIDNDPFNMRSLILELVGPGHLVGTYDTGSTGMGTFHNTLDLTKE